MLGIIRDFLNDDLSEIILDARVGIRYNALSSILAFNNQMSLIMFVTLQISGVSLPVVTTSKYPILIFHPYQERPNGNRSSEQIIRAN
jgi:hypothetical protein